MADRMYDKKFFWTGAIAKICSVAPGTVVKWVDKGFLKGHRISGKGNRYISRENLIAFLKHYDMPLGALDDRSSEVGSEN